MFTAHWLVWHDSYGAIDLERTADLDGLPASDLAMAVAVDRMCREAGAPMRCGQQSGRWLRWDGSGVYAEQDAEVAGRMTRWAAGAHWAAVQAVGDAVTAEIAALPEGRQREARTAAKTRWGRPYALCARLWSDAGQAALHRQLAGVCLVDERKLDAHPGEVIVDNGRVSYEQVLRDGYVRLLPHDPGQLNTMRCGPGVRYDPDARCPWFKRFLETSVADTAQRDWLCWRTLNALFGRMPEKGFVNMIGEKHSGKSTFTELIRKLGGGYAVTVPVETFMVKHASDSGFKQAELRGARFVYTHEPQPGSRYDQGLMKTLTGRDQQRTAGKYEKPVTWTPQLTVFIGSNKPIRFTTSDDAFMERQEVVAFARGYDRMDKQIDARLAGELSGILNELLTYAAREAQHGVPPVPASMTALRERMAEETENALTFLAEWIEEGRLTDKPDASAYASVTVNQLHGWYRSWCEDAGERADGRKTFRQIVERRYVKKLSNGTYHFKGLIAGSGR